MIGEPIARPRSLMNVDDLDAWLAESYPTAFRTACLVLRSSADAEDAVQDAFLRVWRFRDAIPAGDGRRAWLHRVVVNACLSRVRTDGRWRDHASPTPDAGTPAAEPDVAVRVEDSELARSVARAID